MRIQAHYLAFALLVSCATGQPESGLDPNLFTRTTPVIGKDPRGLPFVVFPTDQIPSWVHVTVDGRAGIAWTPRVSERTAMLVPITAFSPDKNAVVTSLSAPQFDGVGTGEAGNVTWSETPYNGPVIIVPHVLERADLQTSWIRAVATAENGRLNDVDGVLPDQYLVIPQPPRGTACRFAIIGSAVEHAPSDCALLPGPIPAPTGITSFHAAPVFTRLGVDMATWKVGAQWVTGVPSARSVRGIALSPVAEPWTASSALASESAALGIRATQDGQPLVAAYWLTKSNETMEASLRISDLNAASGRSTWSEIQLTLNESALRPESALALARAAAIEDRLDEAQELASLAFTSAASLSAPASGLLAGSAAELLAVVFRRKGDHKLAFQWARTASESYGQVGDALRVARAEFIMAGISLENGDLAEAERLASNARSRFFHGGDVWHSALAEARLAEIQFREGKTAEAATMAGYASERFLEMGDTLAAARVAVTSNLITDNPAGIFEYFDAAAASGDRETAYEAASALALEKADVRRGLELIVALAAFDAFQVDPITEFRANQAWSNLCAISEALVTGLDAQTLETITTRCGQTPTDAAVASSPKLLDQAYEALRAGRLDEASAGAAAVAELSKADFTGAAQANILEASILWAKNQDGTPKIQEAIQRVENATAPALVARTLGQLASDTSSQGQWKAAAEVLGGAVAACARTGQIDERRTFAIQRVEALHAARDFASVIEASNQSRPWLANSGARGMASRLRLEALAVDASKRLGIVAPPSDALFAEAEPAVAQNAYIDFAELAYERRDNPGAQINLSQAQKLGSDVRIDVLKRLILASTDFPAAGADAMFLLNGGATRSDLFGLASAFAQTHDEFLKIESLANKLGETPEGQAARAELALRSGTLSQIATRTPSANETCILALSAAQNRPTGLDDLRRCAELGSARGIEADAILGLPVSHDLYRRQAQLVVELQPKQPLDEKKLKRLEDQVSKTREAGGEPLRKAFNEWISYEIATGRGADASKHVDDASTVVITHAPTAQADVERLRLQAMAAAGNWPTAFQHALRMMNEAVLDGNDGAELAYISARIALVVGAREVARPWLDLAASLVVKNPSLSRRIQDTAKLFLLPTTAK